jgi:hypothetical protein
VSSRLCAAQDPISVQNVRGPNEVHEKLRISDQVRSDCKALCCESKDRRSHNGKKIAMKEKYAQKVYFRQIESGNLLSDFKEASSGYARR